jgi:hypothetical protein
MLGYLLHAPRGPFYSPKAARSCWEHCRKAILAFCRLAHRIVRCTTAHRTLSGVDLFPYLAKPTVGALEPLAHRTVRCPLLAVGSATRRARIKRPTVGPATVGSPDTVRCTPDSLMNYNRTPLIISREQQVRLTQPGAPDIVRCTTGQSGAPRQSWLLAEQSYLSSNSIFSVSST